MIVLGTAKLTWALLAVLYTGATRRRKYGGAARRGGGASPVVDALAKSAPLMRKCVSGKRVKLDEYCSAVEALMPAFSAFGRMFDSAARKDVQGNVDKLRRRCRELKKAEARAMVLEERDRDPGRTARPDSAARALFWTNKVVEQIALSFENVLERPRDSMTKCAEDAYLRSCAPYNLPMHRTMARLFLRIVPDRAAFLGFCGAETMDDLAPALRSWVAASAGSRAALEALFARDHPDLAPKKGGR